MILGMILWCDPARNSTLKNSACSTWSSTPGQIREVMATTSASPESPAAPAPQKPYLISSPCPPSRLLDRGQGEAPRLVPPSLHQLATSKSTRLLASLVDLARRFAPGEAPGLRLRSDQIRLGISASLACARSAARSATCLAFARPRHSSPATPAVV